MIEHFFEMWYQELINMTLSQIQGTLSIGMDFGFLLMWAKNEKGWWFNQ